MSAALWTDNQVFETVKGGSKRYTGAKIAECHSPSGFDSLSLKCCAKEMTECHHSLSLMQADRRDLVVYEKRKADERSKGLFFMRSNTAPHAGRLQGPHGI